MPLYSSSCVPLKKALTTEDLQNLNDILKNSESKISFWGKRVIIANGFKGSYSLQDLHSNIIKLANRRFNENNLSTQDRLNGISISKRIVELYDISNKQITQKNYLTRFFVISKIFILNVAYILLYGYFYNSRLDPIDMFFLYKAEEWKIKFGNIGNPTDGDLPDGDLHISENFIRILADNEQKGGNNIIELLKNNPKLIDDLVTWSISP
ncbi:MAG: hypothetical protein KR126chlam6_01110 [Candidatus Anoxychlamydiales bacterium]|nr:hypothetical protein [Candidatus Anoxychlamydiales bacterium]